MEPRMRARGQSLLLSLVLSFLSFPLLAAVTGSVIDNDGQPVAGARVTAYAPESMDARRVRLQSKTPERPSLATATSDSKGNFSLDVKEPFVDVRIEAKGYAPEFAHTSNDDDPLN